LWSQLKRAINNRDRIPRNWEELLAAICEEWEHIDVKDFNKMIRGMPDRIKACIEAKGGHTKW